jgi:phosphopantetheinyl transferase (holo-ACP synthase)
LRKSGALAVTAEYSFEADWRLPALDALGDAHVARWDGRAIYSAGMFHGPIFQSLDRTLGWNAQGIDAELTSCSLDGFFEPGQRPAMVLNPVLLDAMGQLAACWIAENIGLDFNCFPSTIERIELYQPCPEERPGIVLRARQQALDPASAGDITATRSWSFEAESAHGEPLVRVSGLVNVFFAVPSAYVGVRTDPLQGWLGAPRAAPGGPATAAALWQIDNLSDDFCAQSNSIFLRILALATLSFEEREEWRQLKRPVRQMRQWLLGRLCLKEAVRHWLYRQTGELVYPADVVVMHDALGAPWVDGWWTTRLAAAPRVSLSHNSRTQIAAVAVADGAVGVDIETTGDVGRPALLAAALAPSEKAWLDSQPAAVQVESLLRLWCAKEAAAKWLGTGLQGVPEAFEVIFDVSSNEQARVRHGDAVVDVFVHQDGDMVLAVADGAASNFKVE